MVPLGRHRTIYIEPGSPWETSWVKSFNRRVRDELINATKRSPVNTAECRRKAPTFWNLFCRRSLNGRIGSPSVMRGGSASQQP